MNTSMETVKQMNLIYTRVTEKELCVNYFSSEPQTLQCLKNCHYSCFQQAELHIGSLVSSNIEVFHSVAGEVFGSKVVCKKLVV